MKPNGVVIDIQFIFNDMFVFLCRGRLGWSFYVRWLDALFVILISLPEVFANLFGMI